MSVLERIVLIQEGIYHEEPYLQEAFFKTKEERTHKKQIYDEVIKMRRKLLAEIETTIKTKDNVRAIDNLITSYVNKYKDDKIALVVIRKELIGSLFEKAWEIQWHPSSYHGDALQKKNYKFDPDVIDQLHVLYRDKRKQLKDLIKKL